MTSALLVAVIFLAILTFGNLLLCFAVIRRLRNLQDIVVPPALVPDVGHVIEPFELETRSGATVTSGALAAGPVLVAVLSTTCSMCHGVAKELGTLTGLAAAPVVVVVGDPQRDGSDLLEVLGDLDQVAVIRGDHEVLSALGDIRSFPTVMVARDGKVASADTSLDKVLPALDWQTPAARSADGSPQTAPRAGQSGRPLVLAAAATRRPWLRLVGAVAGLTFRAAPVGATVCLAITVAAGVAPGGAAYAIRSLLDELASGRRADGRLAVLYVVLAIGLAAVSLAASYVASYLSSYVQQKVLCLAEDRLYSRVAAFTGLRNIEDPKFHDTMRLAERAVETAPADLSMFVVSAVRQGTNAAVYVGLLLAVWPPMTGLLVLAAVPALIAQLTLARQATQAEVDMVSCQRRRHYFRELVMDPSGAKEIRLFGLGANFHGRMMSALREAVAIEDRLSRQGTVRELMLAGLNLAVSLTGAVIVVLAALHRHVTIGDVSLFLAAIASTQGVFTTVIPQFGRAHRGLRLFSSYLDIVEARPDQAGEDPVPALSRAIEIRDLWFRYDDDGPWVLKGVTFTIPAGCRVGLVGVNGAGKSTLVKLLLRLHDPDRGAITWDGTELRQFDVEQLRDQIRVTSQDFVPFDLSAAENIGVGDLANLAALERIRAAASLAQVDGTLEALAVGYDTLLSRVHTDDLGRTGTTLSGGQWQKVAIARSLMRTQVSLLVLDEPSSGLDAEAEYEIHRVLADREPHTKLLISHRLNAIRDANVILVLSDGQITERGTHDELMGRGGEYARLFALQATGYAPTPTAVR